MNHTLMWLIGAAGLFIALIIVLESGLRLGFGFGRPLLYLADPDIGYLLTPNQRTRRFGNRIEINQYSMRGTAIAPNRSPQTLRILLLGDSIANGGWWTDQSETISALLQRSLQSQRLPFQQVEVLNASANSWGPRNELAYLKKFGSFESQVIVLLLNTDDLFATAPTSVQVGRDPNYPDRQPPLAITEVIQRYLMPSQPIPELVTLQKEGGDRVGINLEAIRTIQAVAARSGAKLLLVMTPLLREVGEPGPRDYEKQARQRLDDFAQQANLPYINVLPLFQPAADPQTLYRDHIHLSRSGNQQVTEQIAAAVQIIVANPDKHP